MKLISWLVKAFAIFFFIVTFFLVHLDRLMTHYNDTPWSFSSVKAAVITGIVRQERPRWSFKL